MGAMAMTGAGVVPGLSDLAGAVAEAASAGAQTDGNGHGTWVATTAAATLNDRAAGCGVAPGARIYPIRIADAPRGNEATTWDAEVAAAMVVAKDSGARIVNISYNSPYVGFHNAALHAPLHMLFADFYATRNGLIFMSSGNDGVFDPTPPVPYLNLVSGIDPTGQLADFGNGKGANWGPAVKFTAPATGIWVSDIDGSSVRVQGTSFSSPIVAAEAALIWERNSALPNFMVEQYLRNSCVTLSGSAFNPYYGWGMPDAQKAVGL
jgi:subtilisin family serine protease